MALWKKLIHSGSNARLANLYASNAVTASFFTGNGALVTGVVSSSYAVSASYSPPVATGETIVTTSSFAVDQNNWNPVSLSTSTYIRMGTSVNLLIITGITAPAASKRLTLQNTGSNTIILTSDDPSSNAANRFSFKRDTPIYPGTTAETIYDLTTAVWKPVGQQEDVPNLRLTQYKSYFGNTATAPAGFTFVSPSGVTVSTVSAMAPAGIQVGHGTSLFDQGYVSCGDETYPPVYSSSTVRTSILFETTIVTPANLSDVTDEYYLICGTCTLLTSVEPEGFYFLYNYSVNSGKWEGRTKGAGTSTVDTGVTVAASTMYKLAIQSRPDNSVAFYVNDAYVGETTTNLPTQPLFAKCYIIKFAGTLNRTLQVNSLELSQIR